MFLFLVFLYENTFVLYILEKTKGYKSVYKILDPFPSAGLEIVVCELPILSWLHCLRITLLLIVVNCVCTIKVKHLLLKAAKSIYYPAKGSKWLFCIVDRVLKLFMLLWRLKLSCWPLLYWQVLP